MTVLGSEGRIRTGERKAALSECRFSTYVMSTADALVSVMVVSVVNRMGPCSEESARKVRGREGKSSPLHSKPGERMWWGL